MGTESAETEIGDRMSPLSPWRQTMLVLVLLVGVLPPGQIFAFMAKGPLSMETPEELRWGCYYPLLWLATMGATLYAVADPRGRRLVWRGIAGILSVLLLVPAVEAWCMFFQARTSLVPPYYGFYPWLPTPMNLVALATTARIAWKGWVSVVGIGLLGAGLAAAVIVPRVRPVVQRVRAQYPLVRQVIDSWAAVFLRSPESPRIRWDDFWVTGVWAQSAPIREITPELLAKCPRLIYLDLASTGVGDDEMAGVEALQDLRELNLNHTRVSDVTLKRAARLPRLSQLKLDNTSITDDGLAHLRDAQQLRQLDLRNTPISGRGVCHLARLQELHGLSLGGTDVQDEDLQHLAGLKSLHNLDLSVTANRLNNIIE